MMNKNKKSFDVGECFGALSLSSLFPKVSSQAKLLKLENSFNLLTMIKVLTFYEEMFLKRCRKNIVRGTIKLIPRVIKQVLK